MNAACTWDVDRRAGRWVLVRDGMEPRDVCPGTQPWGVAVDAALEFMDFVRTGHGPFSCADDLMVFCVSRARRA